MATATDHQFNDLIDRAARALAARDYQAAHAQCIAALKRNPRSAEPYVLLSVLTAEHGNIAKALEIADTGLKHGGKAPRLLAQRAKCLVLLNRHEDAALAANEAASVDPSDEFTLETLGVIFSRIGEHARAVQFFRQAAKLNPGNPEFHYNLGASLQFSGEFDEAEQAYLDTIASKPDHHKAHYGLASVRNQSGEDERLRCMETLFDACNSADERLHLGHAIAKTLEDMGEHTRAMEFLLKAKALKRAELGYEFAQDKALFEAAHRLLDDDVPTGEPWGDGPIFIVGMPRTGTSLVDRILSSHSRVISMGELAHFGLLVKQAAATNSPFVLDAETLDRSNAIDLTKVGESYLKVTERLQTGSPGFIDKMPLNFFYAPLILQALPNARVICVRRNPMDTCVSNFRQLFSTSYSYYNYSYDLEDTGRFFVEFDRLIEAFAERLPGDRFTCVRYEDVIADQESETRRLLGFCGLEFEEACLAFHANPAPIATASSVQVRSPIYASSVGRWKKYGDALAPLAEVMREAGKLKG